MRVDQQGRSSSSLVRMMDGMKLGAKRRRSSSSGGPGSSRDRQPANIGNLSQLMGDLKLKPAAVSSRDRPLTDILKLRTHKRPKLDDGVLEQLVNGMSRLASKKTPPKQAPGSGDMDHLTQRLGKMAIKRVQDAPDNLISGLQSVKIQTRTQTRTQPRTQTRPPPPPPKQPRRRPRNIVPPSSRVLRSTVRKQLVALQSTPDVAQDLKQHFRNLREAIDLFHKHRLVIEEVAEVKGKMAPLSEHKAALAVLETIATKMPSFYAVLRARQDLVRALDVVGPKDKEAISKLLTYVLVKHYADLQGLLHMLAKVHIAVDA